MLEKTTVLIVLELGQLNFHCCDQILVLRCFFGGGDGARKESKNPS